MFLLSFCQKMKLVYFDYDSTIIYKQNRQRTEHEAGSGQLPPNILFRTRNSCKKKQQQKHEGKEIQLN